MFCYFFRCIYEISTGFLSEKTCFFSLSNGHILRTRETRERLIPCMKNRKVNVLGQNRYRPEKAGQTPCTGQRIGFIPMCFFTDKPEHVWSRSLDASVTACERRSTVERVFFKLENRFFPYGFLFGFEAYWEFPPRYIPRAIHSNGTVAGAWFHFPTPKASESRRVSGFSPSFARDTNVAKSSPNAFCAAAEEMENDKKKFGRAFGGGSGKKI